MTTIVLVHGSFHGGWCWSPIVPDLRAAGHDVYTPTLTGMSERHHLVSPGIGLQVNVQDIVGVLEYKDLEDVLLVGHSYGGMVITGAAEHCAERIARLVYLDGFIPEDGQSCWDINPHSKDRWLERTREAGSDWLCPPPDPAGRYEVAEADAQWQRDGMTPISLWTHEERIQLPEERATELPRTYIDCTEYDSFDHMARKAREADFDVAELETGHAPYMTAPQELTEVLLEAAETVSG